MRDYIQVIEQQIAGGNANGYSAHQALQARLETAGLKLDYDLQRAEIGAPTFILWQGPNPAGYIRTAAIGSDLDALAREQAPLPNLILTNYLEFRRYHHGALQQTAELGTLTGQQVQPARSDERFNQLIQAFAQATPTTITRADELAENLGMLTGELDRLLRRVLTGDAPNRDLLGWLHDFQHALPDVTPERFADMVAQATASGLFAARVRHHGAARQQVFNRRDAYWDLPPTDPFLRQFFQITNNGDYDARVTWAVDALAALLARADTETILKDFGKATRAEDLVADFYATFARHYGQTHNDPGPSDAAAQYLVKSADLILGKRFNYHLGLADEHVRVVDFRAGSGKVLYRIVQQMYETLRQQRQLGAWDTFVQDHLLTHVVGYESALDAFAAAHLKLGIQLQRRGYNFASNQRLRLYLAPALQPPLTTPGDSPMAQLLQQERVQSQLNFSRGTIPVIFGEAQNLDFLHEGQRLIYQHGAGVMALVTPSDYLDQAEHTALRRMLIENFRDIYVLRIEDTDHAISIFVKRGSDEITRVHYAAAPTQDWLLERDLNEINWESLTPTAPHYALLPNNTISDVRTEYYAGWKLSDIFPVHLPGLAVAPEHITYTREGAQQLATREGLAQTIPLAYRPFDIRYTPLDASSALRQVLKSENRFLCVGSHDQQEQAGQVFCTGIIPHEDVVAGGAVAFPLYLYPSEPHDAPFPPGRDGSYPNLSHACILELARRLHMTFIPLERGDLKYTFGPKDVFAYLYAILSSSQYHARYGEFLANDLPYVPLTSSKKRFRALAKRGRQLARLHLLQESASWPLVTGFTGTGDDTVSADHPAFIELAGEQGGRVYINQTRYFTGVERRVWKQKIGNHQVLQTWLQQRRGRTLEWAEIHHYQQMVIALNRALRCMETIDELIGSWPLD